MSDSDSISIATDGNHWVEFGLDFSMGSGNTLSYAALTVDWSTI
jgi:hypothetical protein